MLVPIIVKANHMDVGMHVYGCVRVNLVLGSWISDWISGFRVGYLDFGLDFWILHRISGFHLGFLISSWISGFLLRLLISDCVSRFQFGFQPMVYKISLVAGPSGHVLSPVDFTGGNISVRSVT